MAHFSAKAPRRGTRKSRIVARVAREKMRVEKARGARAQRRRGPIDPARCDVTIARFPLRDPKVSKHRIPYMLTIGSHPQAVVSQARIPITGRPKAAG